MRRQLLKRHHYSAPDILSKPCNHSMLFGRVHVTQQHLLSQLPLLTAVGIKQLTDVWKEYAAMVVDLYSQRQQGLQKSISLLPRDFKSMVGSRVLAAREVGLASTATLSYMPTERKSKPPTMTPKK